MLKLRQRVDTYHVDSGEDDAKTRIQASLSTKNRDTALRLIHRLETAIAEGPASNIWPELERTLPPECYRKFAGRYGVKPKIDLSWAELLKLYRQQLTRKQEAGKVAASTITRYELALTEFTAFLEQEQVSALSEITPMLTERFKGWRSERLKSARNFRNGGALDLDTVIIRGVFGWGIKYELFTGKNPILVDKRPGKDAEAGAMPFSSGELAALRSAVGKDLLLFLAFRWTGLRRGDIADLHWCDIDFSRKEIQRITQKRKKLVFIPLHGEFLALLQQQYERIKPAPDDNVLRNQNGEPYTGQRLYQRVLLWGKRANVTNAHPHRFRDSLGVDILLRGGTVADVGKILGDTETVVERHYAAFVPELRDRLRGIMTKGSGLGD